MKPAIYLRRLPTQGLLFGNLLGLLFLLTTQVQGQQSEANSFTSLRLNEVNSYAARHLLTHFTPTTEVKWYREKRRYIAICKEGDSAVRVYYKINGNFECCIKYYLADALDRELTSTLLKKFPGCRILVVTELTNLENEELFIRIKDGAYIRTIHCSNQGMEITESILDITS